MIVYTATIDRPLAPQRKLSGVEFFCFSNVKPPAPWKWFFVEPGEDPTRTARRIKILPWEHFDNWEECVWADANIEVLNIPSPKSDIAIHNHRDRNCIFDEALKCIEYGKDDPEIIRKQIERYSNHPPHSGLWETQMVYRRNTPEIRSLCEDWWHELEIGSRRDQISLPVVLKKHGIVPESLGANVWKKSKWCKRYPKKRKPND